MAFEITPDILIINKSEGNEVMVVEVKSTLPEQSEEHAVIALREYMKRNYTRIALLVTPLKTLIMRKTYLDVSDKSVDGYCSEFKNSAVLFGEAVTTLKDLELEQYLYLKIIELVDSINNYKDTPLSKEISADLVYVLENTQVLKGRVR